MVLLESCEYVNQVLAAHVLIFGRNIIVHIFFEPFRGDIECFSNEVYVGNGLASE